MERPVLARVREMVCLANRKGEYLEVNSSGNYGRDYGGKRWNDMYILEE
jgi:hypothetical protein